MSFREIKNNDDLNFLLENKVSEGIDIEYKKKLPDLSNDDSRLNFLRDICSFANTHGGQIIYGIEETRGKATPKAICGVKLAKPDHDVRKILDIVRDGLDVTLPGVRYRNIDLPDGKCVVVIDIPVSLVPPHRVKVNLDKDHRFYGRNDRQRYELSFHEIRDKFMQSTTLIDKIRGFRASRIAEIKEGKLDINLMAEPAIVLHIIPLTAFSSRVERDPASFKKMYQAEKTFPWFAPLGHRMNGVTQTINLDGFLAYSTEGYVQFYREGIVEAVSLLPKNEEKDCIHSGFYEGALLRQKYLEVLKTLDIVAPFCILISVIGIQGYKLAFSSGQVMHAYNISVREYNESEILLPEVIMDSYDEPLSQVLHSGFDRLCNAWGQDRCMNYDKDGSYIFAD